MSRKFIKWCRKVQDQQQGADSASWLLRLVIGVPILTSSGLAADFETNGSALEEGTFMCTTTPCVLLLTGGAGGGESDLRLGQHHSLCVWLLKES